MDNNHPEKSGFSYTYSAKEQAELKKIREKYSPPTEAEDKMARLRRLDRGVTAKAQTVSLIVGILGTLIMGFGMSLIMTDLGAILGSLQDMATLIGCIIGLLGGTLAAIAYPLYNLVMKRERQKIAPEVIRLTDELMK